MMSSNEEKRSTLPGVSDFYDGKSILLTGAAGYLGVVILETLLRTCPGIESIFILLREKKGVQPVSRKDAIFKKKIFYKLREKHPEVFSKVHVVAGDVTLENLGMSIEDAFRVKQKVSLIFHCAANISFLKPLRFMALHNAFGTYNVIEFSRKLKKLDAVIYTSTAYSNCNRKCEIEEIVYRLPFPAKRFLDALNGPEESFNSLVSECKPAWPNNYSFSKCLAENIISECASDIPIAILRPSIIVCCWKGILPGYIEEGSGLVDLGIAIGKGFVRVVFGDPNCKLNIIPVDVVANTHIVAAWSIATQRCSSMPMVINCVAEESSLSTLKEFHDALFDMTKKYPLPKSFQTASSSVQKSVLLYWIIVIFEHYIPAFVIDCLLRIGGHKPRLVSLYRFYDSAMNALRFFITNSIKFQTNQIKILSNKLNPKDEELFYIDNSSCKIYDLIECIPYGSPFYEWDIDRKPKGERRRIAFVRYLFTSFIKGVVLALIFLFCYLMFSRLFNMNVTYF